MSASDIDVLLPAPVHRFGMWINGGNTSTSWTLSAFDSGDNLVGSEDFFFTSTSFPDPSTFAGIEFATGFVRVRIVENGPNGQFTNIDDVRFESLSTPLDHFKCWQVKDLKNPKFTKIEGLPLDDQFAVEDVDVKKPFLICAPADKDGSGVIDPETHQCCYKIKAGKLSPPENVEVADQFGTVQLAVKKAKFLCQPCTKTVLP